MRPVSWASESRLSQAAVELLTEIRRVTTPGFKQVASAFGEDDERPVSAERRNGPDQPTPYASLRALR